MLAPLAVQLTYSRGDVLLPFFKGNFKELSTNRKLTIDTFLRDVEVLDVEEALVAQSRDQDLRLLLFAFLCV